MMFMRFGCHPNVYSLKKNILHLYKNILNRNHKYSMYAYYWCGGCVQTHIHHIHTTFNWIRSHIEECDAQFQLQLHSSCSMPQMSYNKFLTSCICVKNCKQTFHLHKRARSCLLHLIKFLGVKWNYCTVLPFQAQKRLRFILYNRIFPLNHTLRSTWNNSIYIHKRWTKVGGLFLVYKLCAVQI